MFLIWLYAPCALSAEQLRIGILTDLSATMPAWGRQTVRGAELATKELKAAGLDISLVIEDHAMSTAKAVSAVRKLLEIDKVKALYVEFSLTSMAIAPTVKGKKILTIFNAPVRSTAALQEDFLFRSFTDFTEMCRVIATAWQRRGFDKIAIVRIPSESGDMCAEGARPIYSDLPVLQFNPRDDLTPFLLRLAGSGTKGIINVGLEPDILAHLSLLRKLNLSIRLGAVANMFNDIAEESYMDVLPLADAFGYAVLDQEFLTRLGTVPRESIEASALAYTHIKQMAVSLQRCGSDDLKCQVQTLETSPADPAIGFLGWKQREARYQYRLRSWRNGEKIDLEQP